MVRVIALVLAASAVTLGQMAQYRTLIVSVANADGSAATALASADFAVEVGGVPVSNIEVRQVTEPLSIMLLFDRSASMFSAPANSSRPFAVRRPLLDANTIREAVLSNRQESDREYFGRFSGFTEFRGPIAPNQSAWLEVLAWGLANVPGSSSPIWDSASEASQRIASDPGRKLIVLVSDGRSNANVRSLEDAARQIVRSGVAVSVIDIGFPEQVRQQDNRVALPRPDRLLSWLAEATGGHYVSDANVIRTRTIPAAVLGNLVNLHRHAFSVRINVPTMLASPQSVKVKVNRPGATARTAAFVEVH